MELADEGEEGKGQGATQRTRGTDRRSGFGIQIKLE